MNTSCNFVGKKTIRASIEENALIIEKRGHILNNSKKNVSAQVPLLLVNIRAIKIKLAMAHRWLILLSRLISTKKPTARIVAEKFRIANRCDGNVVL